jgi:hypothetical protein
LLLVSMNTFVFSMGELWGQRTDLRLFDQHVRAVTRFLEHELRAAALPPAARPNSTPIALQEVRPQNGLMEKMLTFELPTGSRLFFGRNVRCRKSLLVQVQPEGWFSSGIRGWKRISRPIRRVRP